jgi:hypothetical protein
MEAAKRLIQKGLIAVVPNGAPPLELSAKASFEIVSDFDNWWRYNPALFDDDDEDSGTNPIESGAPWIGGSDYLLTDTNHGQYSIVNWAPPSSLDPQ